MAYILFGSFIALILLRVPISLCIGMVISAFLAQQSIERMFLAGLVPGLLVGGLLMLYVRIHANFSDFPTQPRAKVQAVAASGRHGFLALIAPGIILSSIMFGLVTATEAGVLACLYCLMRRLHRWPPYRHIGD